MNRNRNQKFATRPGILSPHKTDNCNAFIDKYLCYVKILKKPAKIYCTKAA